MKFFLGIVFPIFSHQTDYTCISFAPVIVKKRSKSKTGYVPLWCTYIYNLLIFGKFPSYGIVCLVTENRENNS
jgi:hypothetical protein